MTKRKSVFDLFTEMKLNIVETALNNTYRSNRLAFLKMNGNISAIFVKIVYD